MNEFQFKGFPTLDWGKILKRKIIDNKCSDYEVGVTRLLRVLFVRRKFIYVYDQKEEGSSILFFQSYHTRNSYIEQLNQTASLVKSDIIRAKLSRPTVSSPLFLFKYVLSWYKELKCLNVSIAAKLDIVCMIIQYYFLCKQILTFDLSQYKLLVTFCDAYEDELFMTEFCKRKGIITATLQHGQFVAKRENVLLNSGLELRASNSDIFLAWNQMTADEIVKQGLKDVKIEKVGIIGYIGKEYKKSIAPNNGTFGVVLTHPNYEADNIMLIKCANVLAAHYNMKYYLKLHPNYDDNHFINIINNDMCLGNVKKGVPMLEYANMVDFSIVSSSSVFCELVYLFHNVLRYSNGSNDDKFRDVPYGQKFSSESDILTSYEKGFCMEENQSLFDYLCETTCVTERYIQFLQKYE